MALLNLLDAQLAYGDLPLLVVGTVLMFFFDAPVTLTLGILALFGFGACGFLLLSAPLESDR